MDTGHADHSGACPCYYPRRRDACNDTLMDDFHDPPRGRDGSGKSRGRAGTANCNEDEVWAVALSADDTIAAAAAAREPDDDDDNYDFWMVGMEANRMAEVIDEWSPVAIGRNNVLYPFAHRIQSFLFRGERYSWVSVVKGTRRLLFSDI